MTKTFFNLNQDKPIGWLVWWTIQKNEYDLQTVEESASRNNVPSEVMARLSGRNRESAWRNATQLGAVGRAISTSKSSIRRVVTRPTFSDGVPSRALVVEETKTTFETEEAVTARTAVIVELDCGQFFEERFASWVDDDPHGHEIREIVEEMRSEMYRIEGRIDDSRIRASLTSWLDKRHKVTVRGSGGVYYLPYAASQGSKEEFEAELLSVREWLKENGCSFSVFGINESGAHSIDDFVRDATEEVKDELKDISDRIKKWEANGSMNAGSKHYSAGTQVERIAGIEEKVSTLKEALGEEIGIVDEMTNMVKSRLDAMIGNCAREMDSDAVERNARRRQVRKEAKKSGRKSGTAKDRQNQATFS